VTIFRNQKREEKGPSSQGSQWADEVKRLRIPRTGKVNSKGERINYE